MGLRTRVLLGAVSALTISLVLAAVAFASAFSQVYADYKAHGKVDPCKFSEQTLKQARQQVPPDIDQYAPDFPAAIDTALQARASGACGTKAVTPAAATPTPSGPSAPKAPPSAPAASAATPAPPAAPGPTQAPLAVHNARASGNDAPAPVIAIAILAGLLALTGLAWSYGRWRGWDPPWLLRTQHAFSEAGYRAESTWAEFTDWLRMGH